MNLATKTMPWTVASLLAASSIFGKNQNPEGCSPPPSPVCKPVKCCETQVPQKPKMCAYNASAEISVGCQAGTDVCLTGSFIYWQPIQDNMDIGLTNKNAALMLGTINTPPEPQIVGDYIETKFSYHPGFKVGVGLDLQQDGWDGYAEYTRVHGTSCTRSKGSGNATNSTGRVPSIFSTLGHPYLLTLTAPLEGMGGQIYNTVSASYKNHLDFVDAEMGRTYHVGRHLIFRPALGARGAWILQNIQVQYRNTQTALTYDPTQIILSLPSVFDVFQSAQSWAIGPRMGLIMDWMFGMGFRFSGRGYCDLLYTKYKVKDKSVLLPFITVGDNLAGVPVRIIGHDRPTAIRPHLDLEMGLGWGSYLDNSNWHVDLSASYGWQVFFNQNMFRDYSALLIGNNTLPNGNLYVQGLTVTARIDF